MSHRIIFILITLLLAGYSARSNHILNELKSSGQNIPIVIQELGTIDCASFPEGIAKNKENHRLVAILLTITLGPFGAHRIYLGTDAKVPIFYTLTLGGGLGLLPLLDLFHLVFTKDISTYYGNNRVFMWAEKKAPVEEPLD